MSEMIERVAIEMRRNRFKRTRRSVFDETIPPTENELDDARAAIEAMREPTAVMVSAGDATADTASMGWARPEYVWPVMIAAALSKATPSGAEQ